MYSIYSHTYIHIYTHTYTYVQYIEDQYSTGQTHISFFFFFVLPVYCYQPITLHAHAHMLSHVTPWTAACQAPLSMDFSRQEYWSGLPFPSPQTHISEKYFQCFNMNLFALLKLTVRVLVIVPLKRCLVFNEM